MFLLYQNKKKREGEDDDFIMYSRIKTGENQTGEIEDQLSDHTLTFTQNHTLNPLVS
jgi:hypothetical protein